MTQAQLDKLIATWIDSLLLNNWDIDSSFNPDETWDKDGSLVRVPGSHKATLLISTTVKEDDIPEAVLHELIHAITAPVRDLADQWMDKLTEDDRKLFERQMSDAEEQVVEHLTSVLETA